MGEPFMKVSGDLLKYPEIDFANLIQKRKSIKIYAIEGNISAGKSTFLERLKEFHPDKYEFIPEPVDVWLNTKIKMEGEAEMNMLEVFYKYPKKYAAEFQIYALFTRMQRLCNYIMKSDKEIFIIERSPSSDYNCFANTNRKEGNIDAFGYTVYKLLYDFIVAFIKILVPDYFIYLRIQPELCYQRLLGRKRPEEISVTLDYYLQKLHNDHEKWLSKEEIPVININACLNYKDDDNILNDIHNSIVSASSEQM